MSSDLIMIFVFVALLVASSYGIKSKYRIPAVFVLYLSGLSLFFLLATNISILFSPFTPKYHGSVIDAETQKPLAGINIKAGWHVSSASVGGSSGEYYKIYKTQTDANGNYTIPRGLKALTVFTPISQSSFEKVIITIYPTDYVYKVTRTHYTNENETTIALEKVKNDKEFLANVLDYYHGLFLMHKGSGDRITDLDEIKWLKYAYYKFEKQYPTSNADEEYMEKIVNILETIKEPDCVYVIQKILVKYPNNDSLVWYAKNNIDALKKIYGIE